MSAWTMQGLDEWTVPGYAEERLLGRGVTGRVVAAADETTGQRVAIKYFDDNLVVRDPKFLRAFSSKAEGLMALDSAHIARLFDYVEQFGQGAAVVTALVEGVSLREMIARRGPLGAEAALVVLKDSLLGLAAAHSLPLPHGDLKPENVLIDAKGWCTLTDLGIAVKTSKRSPAGTPAYMAPELWNGASSAPTTDIYAATAVLWESVTGKPPFSGGLGQVRRRRKSSPVPIEQVDQPLQGLITSGLAKDPADRPQSARSFIHNLEAAADAYGPDWQEHGRNELGERAAALLPLLAGKRGNSASATRLTRRKRLNFALVATTATAALVALAAVALSGMTGKAQPSSLSGAVSAAQVIVTPPVAASTCAASTTFAYSATVTATEPGTLSYRWLYSSGKQGPVQTLSFTAAGSRQVSGGTVKVSRAGEGWGEVKVLSAIAKTSNKATYRLLCTTANSGVVLSASVRPRAQTVFSCAAAPPSLTAFGSIKTKKAESVSYYWALADGKDSAVRTVTLKAPGTKTLAPLKITPPALPASGEAVLVVTKPVAAASRPAAYTVSCVAPVSTTAGAPVPPTSPTSSRSSAGSPPSPRKTTKPPTSTAPTAAPTTTATRPTTSPTPTPTTAPPTTAAPTPTPTPTPTTASPTPTPTPTTPLPTES
jgi:eukaryotic-like serine/threonine-protein kinase